MHSQDAINRLETILSGTAESARNIALLNEAITLLLQKRRTLEEKAITRYFHELISAYGRLIAHLHICMAKSDALDDSIVAAMDRLRTVNEKVRTCAEELLKIFKYNLNFLEQYFEYDYCSKLINEENLITELGELVGAIESANKS